MPLRGYALIFVIWALLTFITPTLIFWSASAKPNLYSQEKGRIEIKGRRMMTSLERGYMNKTTEVRVPIGAPSPAPLPMRGDETEWSESS